MHNDTAYGLLGNGLVRVHKVIDGIRTRVEDNLKVIEFADNKASERHGLLPNGLPRPYKGYKGDSNYCIEVSRNQKGRWEGNVVTTFEAYQVVREGDPSLLRRPRLTLDGKPLVMRLLINDFVRLEINGNTRTMRVASMSLAGRLTLADHQEANTDARNRDTSGTWRYAYKQAGSLQTSKARRIAVSPIGELHDPGYKE